MPTANTSFRACVRIARNECSCRRKCYDAGYYGREHDDHAYDGYGSGRFGEAELEQMLMCFIVDDDETESAGPIVFMGFAHNCFFLNFAAAWTGS